MPRRALSSVSEEYEPLLPLRERSVGHWSLTSSLADEASFATTLDGGGRGPAVRMLAYPEGRIYFQPRRDNEYLASSVY